MLYPAFSSDIENTFSVNRYVHNFTETQIRNTKELISKLEKIENISERRSELAKLSRQFGNMKKSDFLEIYKQLVSRHELMFNSKIEELLITKIQKSGSGIISITLVTSPGDFSCPQDCYYCPNEPGMPRSYLSNSPSVLRARSVSFDVLNQFRSRAFQLIRMGHLATKIEVIILGGTWSYHTLDYQEEFIKGIYFAANTLFDSDKREKLSLEEEITLNETSDSRIIGLTIETRPDQINEKEIRRLRRYNVTRVQLGIQHIENKILKHINRKCTNLQNIQAIEMLKTNGFKVDGHFMLDLPGSSKADDIEMFDYLFSQENLGIQVDQMKIYPTMTTEFTKILEWYNSGEYTPYSENTQELFDVIVGILIKMPRWIRVNRIVRDIPSTYIVSKFKESNMNQRILRYFSDNNLQSKDIRMREIKFNKFSDEPVLKITNYVSGMGVEYFIEFVTPGDKDLLIGFLRLRINEFSTPFFEEIQNSGIIRELHVYGKLISQEINSREVDETSGNSLIVYNPSKIDKSTSQFPETQDNHYQHKGIGKRLIAKAEEICKLQNLSKISVISGVGVRKYYEKQGFKLVNTYMIKCI